MWMGRKDLAAAFDMEGAFNDLTATLAPAPMRLPCWHAIDRLAGALWRPRRHGRRDQPSHRFLTDEIAQQGVMATTMPAMFLAVAVFLLHGMLGRLVGTQREQVAGTEGAWLRQPRDRLALREVRPRDRRRWRCDRRWLLGFWFGHMLVENYTRFFRFPQLAFHIAAWIPVLALAGQPVAGSCRSAERDARGDRAGARRSHATAGAAALSGTACWNASPGCGACRQGPDGAAPSHRSPGADVAHRSSASRWPRRSS